MLERTKAKMNFLKYMDGAVFSCDVKEVKPEPAIYKILLEDYGLKLRSVYLLTTGKKTAGEHVNWECMQCVSMT